MKQTSILLPLDLKRRAEDKARDLGISLGAFIRSSLEQSLKTYTVKDTGDSLFSSTTTYNGKTPKDLSKNHDDYLYGDEE